MKYKLTDLDDLLYDFLKWLNENEKEVGVESFYEELTDWQLSMLESIFHRIDGISQTGIYKNN